MPKAKISELLKQLEIEIENVDALPDQDKDRLGKLINTIEQGMNDDSLDDELNQSLVTAVADFEASHPRLTAIINDILVTLSNMGI